jgi:anaerobic magnesium-protoporphyrin IX monomethyl ester cyclase
MNVLLVNPASAGVFNTFGLSLPPMGLLYVAASLERAGHSVVVKDLQIEPDGLTSALLKAADVVGISSDTTRITKALKIARQAAACGRPVVMGGPHPMFLPDAILGSGHATYIIKGEGEESFPRLLAALERKDAPETVPGIIWRDGLHTRETPVAPVPDIELLPFPARHLVDLTKYSANLAGRPLTAVVTSRGCPGACRFCASSSFFGTGWRNRSAASVLAELDEVYNRYGFRAVAFTDDNFTLSPSRVTAIADGIRARSYDLKWWNFSRIDTIVGNPEMVRTMAAAGSSVVYLGIESESQETLQSLGKRGRVDEAAQAVKLLHENGIEVYGSYMIGALNERRADVEQTIRMAMRLDTEVAQFSILTPYPGTPLYDELLPRIFDRRWKFYDGLHLVFRHPHINRHLLQLLLIKAYIRFYRRSQKARDGFKIAGRQGGFTFRKAIACAWELFF